MELLLFILLLLTGGVSISLSITCNYYLIQQGKTWSEAQVYCRSTYNDLVTTEIGNDMIRLQEEAQKQHLSSTAWIGLWNDINSWRWSFGNEPLGNWTDWGPGEPDNKNGQEECGGTNQWTWFDASCVATLPFVCFTENFSGTQRFTYYSNLLTWSKAQTFCRWFHTNLATPRDSIENSLLQQYLASLAGSSGSGMDSWIGLFRDSWKWSDQTVFSTINWEPGQPSPSALHYQRCQYSGAGTPEELNTLSPSPVN